MKRMIDHVEDPVKGDIVTAARLNKMEQRIEDVYIAVCEGSEQSSSLLEDLSDYKAESTNHIPTFF
ncbi:hypothetical protein [Ammoniphilus sp. 3BR4]|uniref:hypothetical protein n=1 Tax=Ammoniphilus sp. 3BR4 TaxID=3158265 RepID=UPI003466F98F